eukprot:COSAG01_NODE_6763_length_3508_cov_49.836364_4_plen_85_part_00
MKAAAKKDATDAAPVLVVGQEPTLRDPPCAHATPHVRYQPSPFLPPEACPQETSAAAAAAAAAALCVGVGVSSREVPRCCHCGD